MYAEEEGILQDYTRAQMWFNIAASQGNEGGKTFRDSIEELMIPSQLVTAQRLARECVRKNYKGC